MRYAYYPGCSLHSMAKDYDASARAVCQALGIELLEIPGWNCCGASSGHMTSELLSTALPVRDLIAAQQMGMDVAVCCAACYSRLRTANRTMRSNDRELVHQVDQVVGATYRGESQVQHLLQIVIEAYGLDALQAKVTTKLEGLKVAAYYGCLLVRPPELVAFDDPDHPTCMEKLITTLGAEPVDWPYKTECCGAGLSLTRTEMVLKLCHDIYAMALSAGAECLMVACPLCHANLDMRQMQVNRAYKTDMYLPVLYFTQLIGLALGMEAKKLGLDKSLVNSQKLLRARELA
jgi:heterodisulfide reductase subunit B